MQPVIIIPAYKPETSLISLVRQLAHTHEVIIVNDGSGDAYLPIFIECEKIKGVSVLAHAVNLGKGQALKTAFNYFLTHMPSLCPGVITADADGQHLPEDILKVSRALLNHPAALWLGVRDFKTNVPWRSRIGNNLTRSVFKLLIGHSLQDTQTGLRGIPRPFVLTLLKTTSQGYDFELDMLISAAKQKIKINEMPIQTVYKDDNKSSHFNPLIDSLKIYFVFFRFLLFSMVSGLLDFCAFTLTFLICNHVFLSESLARIFSGTCNFLLNKELVFKSKQKALPEAIKYALLCLGNLLTSYGLITTLVFFGINVFVSKMIALIGLFIANFAIQKLMVFGKEEDPLPRTS